MTGGPDLGVPQLRPIHIRKVKDNLVFGIFVGWSSDVAHDFVNGFPITLGDWVQTLVIAGRC
jgi:hypothetical protein